MFFHLHGLGRVILRQQLLQPAVIQLAAVSQHHYPGAQGSDIFHVVCRQQDGGSLFRVLPPQEVPQCQLAHRVQAYCRLIQVQQLRAVQQASAQFRPHPLSQAQQPQRRPQKVSQLQCFCQFIQPFLIVGFRNPVDILQQGIAVQQRHVPPQLCPLAEHYADVAHMLLPVLPGNPAAHGHRSALRNQDPGEDLDCRGLPGTVRADISYQFPFFDLEGNVLQRVHGFFFAQQRTLLPLFADDKRLTEMVDKNIAHEKILPIYSHMQLGYLEADYSEFFCESRIIIANWAGIYHICIENSSVF